MDRPKKTKRKSERTKRDREREEERRGDKTRGEKKWKGWIGWTEKKQHRRNISKPDKHSLYLPAKKIIIIIMIF